jgi:hypothetical protein
MEFNSGRLRFGRIIQEGKIVMSAWTRHKVAVARALVVGPLFSLPVYGQPANGTPSPTRAPAAQSARIPLTRAESQEFPGDTAEKDFFFQLPEHVALQAGCELRLALYPSREVLPRLCTVAASVNGIPLSNAIVEDKGSTNDLVIRLRFALPEGSLAPGWDRVSVRFVLTKTGSDPAPAGGGGTWTIRRADSQISLVYRRIPLFPELVRFPASVAEEKLLHLAEGNAGSSSPVLALLLPAARRDVHLRGCAVIGARLGQLGYVSAGDCRVASLEDWQAENRDRNGIALGLRDELASLPLPKDLAEALANLAAGQGMVAEFITGSAPDQRRWLLVAGADDAGLEKAILTLGSAPALAAAPPNPALIDGFPEISRELEAMTQPGATRFSLKELGVAEVRLSGIHASARSVPGWRLPPGFDLASGALDLQFSHSPALLAPGSWLDVMLDGRKAGTIELTPKTASGASVRVPMPKGFAGRDPMLLTFRAHLDVPPVACNQRKEDEPWLLISGDSALESVPSLMRVQGLNQYNRLLLRDSFLRRAALLVPGELSPEELRWLLELSMRLGQQLPSSPVLWPEVCSYSKARPPAAARLQDRSILLLGSVAQWSAVLPPEAPVLLKAGDPPNGVVRMQGNEVAVASFEPSLVFVQLLGSPWSPGEWLAVAGGWNAFATAPLMQLLTDPEVTAELHGNICALDDGGRLAAYESRGPARDSLAERIHSRIPSGLSTDETRLRAEAQQVRLRWHGWVNNAIFYTCGILFGLVVGCRVLLMWERTQLFKKTGREESRALEVVS